MIDKQIALESALYEYELNYYNKDIKEVDIKNVILHKVYSKISKNYSTFIQDYTINGKNNSKLAKMLKGSSKDQAYGRIIIMLIYFGIERSISFSFYNIINNLKFLY